MALAGAGEGACGWADNPPTSSLTTHGSCLELRQAPHSSRSLPSCLKTIIAVQWGEKRPAGNLHPLGHWSGEGLRAEGESLIQPLQPCTHPLVAAVPPEAGTDELIEGMIACTLPDNCAKCRTDTQIEGNGGPALAQRGSMESGPHITTKIHLHRRHAARRCVVDQKPPEAGRHS